MTDVFKEEQKFNYVNYILKTMIDPLDRKAKVALIGELLKRLQHHLPPEIASQPAERYANNYETLFRAYIKSVDQVRSIFRSY
jgi:hypothetical protein